MYSNCCCSCSFEREIIKIGQSSHKMYSNNIVNSQESTTILNARTKRSVNLLKAPRMYIFFFLSFFLSRHTHTHTHTLSFFLLSLSLYIYKVKLATVVEGDQKAPFSLAITLWCSGGRYSFPWITPLYP